MAGGSESEGGLRTARVGVVPVDALPCMSIGLKGEVSGEEEDVGTGFAVLAHPAAGQKERSGRTVG